MFSIRRIIFVLVLFVGITPAAFGATYTVTKTADTADVVCDADCSLREAVVAANATGDSDTIVFSSFFNVPRTITLGGTDIIITNAGTLHISGPGKDLLTVSGNNASRVFTNNTGSVATISNLRVSGGTGVSTVTTGRGGGIYNNAGTLTLQDLVVTGNAAANGGAANNAGIATLNIFRCVLSNNTATGSGGALQNFAGNTTNIRDSVIISNTSNSTTGGGAMQANGTVNITNTTIANNTANTGSGGGIIFNGTALSITNSTIVGNTSTSNGGGIHKSTANPGVIRNSIVSGNNGVVASPDLTGVFNSEGTNIIGNVGTATGWIMSDLQNTNPLISPFGYYGGNGYSFALLSGSPAINGGQNCVTDLTCATGNPPVALTADQRGAPRVGNVDIGAFELNNTANGGTFLAYLPAARETVLYGTVIVPSNGAFNYTITGGTLPTGVGLNTALAPDAVVSVSGTPTVNGTFDFTVTASDGVNSNVTNYRLNVLAPTAAAVSIGGRVLTAGGTAVRNAVVSLALSSGATLTTRTGTFGYFRFDDISVGQTVVVSVNSKRYQFVPRTISVDDELTDIDIVAQ